MRWRVVSLGSILVEHDELRSTYTNICRKYAAYAIEPRWHDLMERKNWGRNTSFQPPLEAVQTGLPTANFSLYKDCLSCMLFGIITHTKQLAFEKTFHLHNISFTFTLSKLIITSIPSHQPATMFTKSFIVAALGGLASAARLTARDSYGTGAFGLIAINSGSAVQNAVITASQLGFWINKPTISYCPPVIGDGCPAGNTTAFTYNNATGGLQMDVAVPGGQQVFTTPDGQFGYTVEHSAALPAGAVVSGWTYTPAATAFNVGTLKLNGTYFLACPTGDGDIYQVISNNGTVSSAFDSCIGINLATVGYTGGVAAWEYE